MALPEPNPYFTVTATGKVEEFVATEIQKALQALLDSDAVRDECGLPRKGREPDFLFGRFCPRCHNSLPDDWTSPCDVCGAATSSIGFGTNYTVEPTK